MGRLIQFSEKVLLIDFNFLKKEQKMASIFHKELERKVENKKLIDEDGGHEA